MAVFRFSALSDGQAISFDPTVDVLNIDPFGISAASLRVTASGANTLVEVVNGQQAGKDFTLLNTVPSQLSISNITFANGSQLLFGDATSSTQNDNAANSITGTAGRDLLAGFGGADTMNGGPGDDVYIVGTGDVLVDANGIDEVESDLNWTLADGFENLTATGAAAVSLTGNNGANRLTGNAANNFFNPRGGDDNIQGGAGNDVIRLGGGGVPSYGNKVIDGGTGFDQLDFGGFARSAIVVDLAAGTLSGGGETGAGRASLSSIESVIGDGFDDRISGSTAAELLAGGAGNDTLSGLADNDTLVGGVGQDLFVFASAPGGAGDVVTDFVSATDKLSFSNFNFPALGTPGNFVAGDARFAAGAGFTSGRDASDRLVYNTTTGQLFYDADGNGAGSPLVVATLQGAPALAATDIQVAALAQGTGGDDSLTGSPVDDTIGGLGGNDTISGLAGDDMLFGATGRDSLLGGDGDDHLEGDPGSPITPAEIDTLDGGLGNDTYVLWDQIDVLTDPGGVDTIVARNGESWALPAGIENLVLTPGSTFSLVDQFQAVGNELNNVIRNEHNESQPGRGARMDGADGNDTLIGGTGPDVFTFSAGSGSYGNDSVDGGDWLDSLVVGERSAVVVDFRAGTVVGGGTGGSGSVQFRNIEGATAGSFNDRLVAGDSGVFLEGAGGNDTIIGGAGNDDLGGRSETGDDQIFGGAGNDLIMGGSGNNLMDGGAGDDSFFLDATQVGLDTISGGEGLDEIDLFGASGAVVVDLSTATITGAGLDGRLTFSSIEAFSERGGRFNDHIIGSDGANLLAAVLGDDLLEGGAGDDTLIGGGLDDFDPAQGNNTLDGGLGNDSLVGTREVDNFLFRAPGTGADRITSFGTDQDSLLFDNTGFTAIGAAGRFAPGDARFFAGAGATSGQDASDRIIYDTSTGNVYYDADGSGGGASQLIATVDDFGRTPALAATHLEVVGAGGSGGATIQGTAGNDSLTGTEGNDSIAGLAGADSINALGGNDTLDGGAGIDTMNGGLGDDTYIVTANDQVSDPGGIDTVVTDIAWSLNDGFENLTVTGTANVGLTGNNGTNVLTGNAGNNFINPRGGNDTISAKAGDDFVRLGGGGVTSYGSKVIDLGAGFDGLDFGGLARSAIVVDLAAGTLSGGGDAGAGNATLSGIEQLIGDGFNDRLSGSAAAESLNGGAGNDTIDGRGGNDTLTGGAGLDTFAFASAPGSANADQATDFASAADKLSFDNAVFTALGAPGNFVAGDARFAAGAGFTSGRDASDRIVYNTTTGQLFYDADGNGAGISQLVATLQGAPALSATDILVAGTTGPGPVQGTEGNDTLTGTPGNDTIDGRGGNDLITGLDGADSLIGGAGNDTLNGGAGTDTMDGGFGDDTYIVDQPLNPGADVLIDAGGIDTIIVDATSHGGTLPDGFENMTVRGTPPFPDFEPGMFGNAANNVLRNESNAPVMTFIGGGGNDTLIGGNNEDHFSFGGAYGNDVVDGGGGVDTLFVGDSSAAVVDGRVGTVSGGGTGVSDSVTFSNIEVVQAGFFDDLLIASDAGMKLSGNRGNDTLIGGAGNDRLFDDAVPTDFPFDSATGNDSLSGGAGDDLIAVRRGNDTAQGGAGNDIISVESQQFSSDLDSIDGGDGVDTVETFAASNVVVDLAAGTLTHGDGGRATLTGIENFSATHFVNAGPQGPAADIRGNSGANVLIGNEGADTFDGRGGNDTLTGAGGADHFIFDQAAGAANADRITDFASGADKLHLDVQAMTALGAPGNFAAGDARFFAAAGASSGHDADDRIVYNTTTGELSYDADGSGAGTAQIIATLQGAPALAASDIAVVSSAPVPGATIRGTEGDDNLTGTGGNDTIDGLGGNDILDGGPGSDLVRGGSGNDRLKDREDSDAAAPDTLDGGLGDDIFDLLANPLRPHTTVLVDAGGVDTVWSNHDNFVLPAGIENLTLFEGRSGVGNELGNMIVTNGNQPRYFIDGAGGNDTLAGAPDSGDNMTGGAGNDVFAFTRPSDPLQGAFDTLSDFVSASDRLQFDNRGFTQLGAAGNFAPGDARFASGPSLHQGQDPSDRLIYDTDNFNLYYDPDGNGPTQSMLVAHLDGARVLVATDIVVIGDAAAGGQVITGTAGNDSLTGTAGDDTLDGGAGVDTMNGGLGNDTYIVTANDQLSDPGGIDTVQSAIDWSLVDGFENLTLTGTGNVSATGNNGVNVLSGNSGNNFFNPRGGNDTIVGGAGNDFVRLGGGGVTSYGSKVIDLGTGFDGLDFGGLARSAIVVDLAAGTLSGGGDGGTGNAALSGIEQVIGDGFNDRLSGSAAAESLNGGAGNDTINGRGGNDTLTGGLGADTFVFATAPGTGNVDLVTDVASASDRLNFDNAVFTALGADGNFVAGDARFAAGAGFTSGRDASDRIVYDTTTGNLYYDADGSGAGGAQLVATLQGHPAVAATDISVI